MHSFCYMHVGYMSHTCNTHVTCRFVKLMGSIVLSMLHACHNATCMYHAEIPYHIFVRNINIDLRSRINIAAENQHAIFVCGAHFVSLAF